VVIAVSSFEGSDNDGLQFADTQDREQPRPPTGIVGFNIVTGPAKDRSPIAGVDPDGPLISLKEMPVTSVEANHDAREIACWEVGDLTVERAPLVDNFERRQNATLPGVVESVGLNCESGRNRRQ
jgi:hypothetical protein